ncbi:MAG: glycosyltransferase family 4 protein [Candidatus Bathyarchaeia archaeon]
MRIGVLTSGFDPCKLEAVNRSVFEINLRLKRGGHEVFIITNTGEFLYEIEGIKIYGLPKKSSFGFGFFYNARNIIRKLNTDLCHFYGSLSGAILFSHFFRDFERSVIASIYDNPLNIRDLSDLRMSDLRWDPLRTLNAILNLALPPYLIKSHLEKLDKIILLGEDRRFDLEFWLDKIAIVPHGVDFHRFAKCNLQLVKDLKSNIGFCNDVKVVLYYGHCYPSRGIEDLVMSFRIINKEMRNARLLLVVTPSSYLEYIRKIIKKHDLSNCTTIITQWINNPEHYFWLSDIVVVPYRFKTFVRIPFVLLEAMAAGRPVVVTDIANGCFLVEHMVSGLVVKRGRKKDLASAILSFLRDETFSIRCGLNAQQRVQPLDWDKVSIKVLKIYSEELEKGNAKSQKFI